MIEIFKTNVRTKTDAIKIAKMLKGSLGYEKVNFDLEDCDKILRIESPTILTHSVIGILRSQKIECEPLI